MKHWVFGPRHLQCQAVLKHDKRYIDPSSKRSGRCGECKACWRLFVHVSKSIGLSLPRAKRDGSIAGFRFTSRKRNAEA